MPKDEKLKARMIGIAWGKISLAIKMRFRRLTDASFFV
jgi:hypothetical protein